MNDSLREKTYRGIVEYEDAKLMAWLKTACPPKAEAESEVSKAIRSYAGAQMYYARPKLLKTIKEWNKAKANG